MTDNHTGALSGLKVLDLSQGIAGPYCTKLLADYGAEVIKVEEPRRGDVARSTGPFPGHLPHHEKSGLFLHLNTNKKSVTLNLNPSDGASLCKALAGQASLVVEDLRPGVLQELGLGYKDLAATNPRLVMVSITSFGQTGPYRDYKYTELVAEAISGIMYSHGAPDREPLKFAQSVGQYLAGLTAAIGAMGAVLAAKLQGIGQYVDVSIMESLAFTPDRRPSSYFYTGGIIKRLGYYYTPSYLVGAYPCKDGFVGIQGVGRGEAWWPRIYNMMGMPELTTDPRFSKPDARLANRGEFDVLFYSWLADRTRQEVFEEAAKARFPLAPVYTTEDLLRDPHFKARGFFVDVEHPAAGRITQTGAPFKLSETPWKGHRPAPLLGQHNEEVFCHTLGYSRADLAQLREQGAI